MTNRSYFTSTYNAKDNKVILWETDKNKIVHQSEHKFVPFLYIKLNNGTVKTKMTSLTGSPVIKKEFDNIFQMKKWVQDQSRDYLRDNVFENSYSLPEQQFIVERYLDQPANDRVAYTPNVQFFDIETDSKEGFPEPDEAKYEIQSNTVYDRDEDKYYVFGLKDFDRDYVLSKMKIVEGEYESVKAMLNKTEYIKCDDEAELIFSFLTLFKNAWIYTGWNTNGYDWPYIINRVRKHYKNNLALQKALDDISPTGEVSCRKKKSVKGMISYKINIVGKTSLDYLEVYKAKADKQTSYKLGHIGKVDLKKGKIEVTNEDAQIMSLSEIYEQKFDEFIVYNLRDVELVYLLDMKYGFIEFLHMISVQSNIPIERTSSMSNLIDGALLHYLRMYDLVAPPALENPKQNYGGGYVKESLVGIWDWLVDFDITSSYPFHQICLNISTETYIGKIYINTNKALDNVIKVHQYIKDIDEDEKITIVNSVKEKLTEITIKDFKKMLSSHSVTIAADGNVYSNTEYGIMPRFLLDAFNRRKSIKSVMIEAKGKIESTEIESEKEFFRIEADKFNKMQLFAKLIINSVYGQLANRFSRWYNIEAASSVTSSGALTIKSSELFIQQYFKSGWSIKDMWLNDLWDNVKKFNIWDTKDDLKVALNKVKHDTKDFDYVSFIDTDSNGVTIGPALESLGVLKRFNTDDDIIEFILAFCVTLQKYIDYRIRTELKETLYNSDRHDCNIEFKQEIIAKRALITGKKKYGLWVVDKEGVRQDKMAITGLDIIKSDTPDKIKVILKGVLEALIKIKSIDEREKTVTDLIKNGKKIIRSSKPIEVSKSVMVNNLNKWKHKGKRKYFQYNSGTPMQSKAVIFYNDFLKREKIFKKYFPLKDGTKVNYIPVEIKDVKLLNNNINVMAFDGDDIPLEIKRYMKIDYDTLIQKILLDKVKILLTPLNMNHCLYPEQAIIKKLFG